MHISLSAQLEAILFWKGEPVSRKRLAEILKTDKSGLDQAAAELEASLSERGLVLVQKEDELMLGTSPAVSNLIEQLTKDELVRDLGKAGLETLSIVLYKGPLSRREIDHIRGVNSNFILRNLLIRGLVEKVNSPTDQRSFLYKPTMELLTFMGLTKLEDLPEYASMREKVQVFEAQAEEQKEEPKV
jgi:segregation and condensation protein B